jgi:phosphoribosyl 1,2-cyclic phosphodiesterase
VGLQVCVLASGSSGNCVYVGNEQTRILIDAGVSCRVICERLVEIGIDPTSIQALCVTHEHTDHHAGLSVLHRKLGLSLFGNAGTVEALGRVVKHHGLPWNIFTTGQSFRIGGLQIEPFRIPHDSNEPVAYVIGDGVSRVGVCTDLGIATDLVRSRLRDCDVVVLEANHDEELLMASSRPWPLKQRILGHKGHLSNHKAAELLCEVASDRLQAVFLAHLSRDCNHPRLAEGTVRKYLDRAGFAGVALYITHADGASVVLDVNGGLGSELRQVCSYTGLGSEVCAAMALQES